jgi:predicted dehydrogenase
MVSVSGGAFTTKVTQRAVPLGTTYGHAKTELSDVWEPVENDDVKTFTAQFANGAVGTFSISRIAPGHANSLAFDLMAEHGGAKWDMDRPAEFSIVRKLRGGGLDGYNQVLAGPAHPYVKGGLPMDFPGCSYGVGDLFGYQARAFLEQVAGAPEPRVRVPAPPPSTAPRTMPQHHAPARRHSTTPTSTPRHDQIPSGKDHPSCSSAPTTPASPTRRSARPSTSSPASA